LLCPDNTVLLPDMNAGCSLADSITPQDIRALRARYPGTPVVCYVNTSAAVKAECDVCCTSSNAVQVVESLGVPRVIVVPDEYLAAFVAERTSVEIISWRGHCEVHERFTGRDINEYRNAANVFVLAHPECPVDVQEAADYVGSTAGMIDELAARKPKRAMLLTECSMADNVALTQPSIEFVQPCNLCPHMKLITLAKIRDCLASMSPVVEVDPATADAARRSVQRMLQSS
jgi:quinolinate synthase